MENSSVGRLLGVLTSPGKTFRSIAERPTWVAPLVAMVLISGLSWVVLLPRIDRESFRAEMQEQAQRRGQPMSEEQLDKIEKLTVGCLPAAAVVGIAFYFGLAGLLMGATHLFGGQIDYRRSLSVTLHAYMPFALLSLLSVPVALGREAISLRELQGGSLLPSSLAAVAPEEASRRMLALLAGIDLFSLWTIALLILGFHLVGRVSRGAIGAVVVVLWLLWIGFRVLGAGMGGG